MGGAGHTERRDLWRTVWHSRKWKFLHLVQKKNYTDTVFLCFFLSITELQLMTLYSRVNKNRTNYFLYAYFCFLTYERKNMGMVWRFILRFIFADTDNARIGGIDLS